MFCFYYPSFTVFDVLQMDHILEPCSWGSQPQEEKSRITNSKDKGFLLQMKHTIYKKTKIPVCKIIFHTFIFFLFFQTGIFQSNLFFLFLKRYKKDLSIEYISFLEIFTTRSFTKFFISILNLIVHMLTRKNNSNESCAQIGFFYKMYQKFVILINMNFNL